MNAKEELLKVINECFNEFQVKENINEGDVDFELLKETTKFQILQEKCSPEDESFILNNLDLYRKLVMALLNEDDKEMKLVLLEMVKKHNCSL